MVEAKISLDEETRLDMIDGLALEMSEDPEIISNVNKALGENKTKKLEAIKKLRFLIKEGGTSSIVEYRKRLGSIPEPKKPPEGKRKPSNEFAVVKAVVDLISPAS